MNRRIYFVIGAVVSLSLLLAACEIDVGDDDVADDDPAVTEETPTPEVDPAPPEEEEELSEEVIAMIEHGEEIYERECAGCHGPDGEGDFQAGFGIPALNENSLVTAEEPLGAVSTLLTGRGGMPRFSGLDDEEIASLVTYLRQAWDNDAPHIEADTVEEVRDDIYGED